MASQCHHDRDHSRGRFAQSLRFGDNVRHRIGTLFRVVTDVLAADRCVACGALVTRAESLPTFEATGWCAGCAQSVVALGREFCLECTAGERRWRCLEPAHLRLRAAVQYGDAVAALVRAAKYERKPGLTGVWIRVWASALQASQAAPGADLQLPEAIVPVPQHRVRVRERGFDIVGEWAARLARLHGVPLVRALSRPRATPQQVGRDRERRRINVSGALAPGPEAITVRARRIAIVDDVVTTGATALEAGRVLRRLGSSDCIVWSFAYEPLE